MKGISLLSNPLKFPPKTFVEMARDVSIVLDSNFLPCALAYFIVLDKIFNVLPYVMPIEIGPYLFKGLLKKNSMPSKDPLQLFFSFLLFFFFYSLRLFCHLNGSKLRK